MAKLRQWVIPPQQAHKHHKEEQKEAVLLKLAHLHYEVLQNSHRWQAPAINWLAESKELLARVELISEPEELMRFIVDEKEQVQIENRDTWREWLATNHNRESGVWLVTFKKHVRDKFVARDELIEEAICFGWIDSLPRKLDEDRTMVWMAPRKPGSGWSKINKQRVARMIKAGKMTKYGLEKIEAAKEDGSWSKLDSIETMEIPADLDQAFKSYPSAKRNFEQFPKSVKRSILEWIENAKRPATRQKRIEETARLAEENIRANQWRQ